MVGEKREKTEVGVCAMCQQRKKYVDAHIIPRAFFEYMRPPDKKNEPFEIITNNKGVRNSISRIGIYDNQLICLECEKLFQNYDDYGQEVLLQRCKGGELRDNNGKIFGRQISDVDYAKLKMFFLSVLWRAAKSKTTSRLRLGEYYENILQEIILNKSLEKDVFDCVLARHEDWLGQMYLLDPVSKIRFPGSPLNFALIYLGAGYKLYVKIDKRPFGKGDSLLPLVFRKGSPLHVVKVSDFINSKEFGVLKTLL